MSPLIVPRPLARSTKDQPMCLTTPAAGSTTSDSVGDSRRRPLARRAASVVTTLAAAAAATLSLAAAPALAGDCPNAALRAQNNSTQLPDCRAYELVSPVFKEGFASALTGFTDDGRVSYLSNGNFADNGLGAAALPGGNQYMAVRSASGWATTALAPHGPIYYSGSAQPQVLSRDLRSSMWVMRRSDQPVDVSDLYLRGRDDVFTRIGSSGNPLAPPTLSGVSSHFGASDDLSHIVFTVGPSLAYPGTVPSDYTAYEYVGTGNDGPPRPISVDNAGQQIAPGCSTPIGDNESSSYHAISSDGRVIFFVSKCGDTQVWARVSGTTTIKASASQCTRAPSDPGGACNADSAPLFQGANADGTRVYLTTSQQLVDGDTDATNDLYECDIPTGTPAPVGAANPCPDLHEVSGAASGADVEGVTRISDDGSRAYFVAKGVLAANSGANDAVAVAGDDNLYVWHRDAAHPAGETRFVAKLDPGDGANIAGLWSPDKNGRLAQATDDGRYLVFGTYAALIDHGQQADTDTARDVYRYDADSGSLTRLSIDADGDGGNESGHDAGFPVINYPEASPAFGPRGAMSDDGGSVVFTTDEALAPDDTNGTIDTYLWRDGRVWLISSGKPSDDSFTAGVQAWITSSGRDLYFTTTAHLTPNDVDTVPDIYNARIDGGFDVVPPAACGGDACQGGRSAPPPAPQPGSSSPTGQDGPSQTTPAFSLRAVTAAERKRIASTGKVSLSVSTNAPGMLSASAAATIAKKLSSVGSAKRNVTKAGTVTLSLALSKKARAVLKSTGRLSVKVLVSQDNVAISRTVSLKLTEAKTVKKKASHTTSRHTVVKGGRS